MCQSGAHNGSYCTSSPHTHSKENLSIFFSGCMSLAFSWTSSLLSSVSLSPSLSVCLSPRLSASYCLSVSLPLLFHVSQSVSLVSLALSLYLTRGSLVSLFPLSLSTVILIVCHSFFAWCSPLSILLLLLLLLQSSPSVVAEVLSPAPLPTNRPRPVSSISLMQTPFLGSGAGPSGLSAGPMVHLLLLLLLLLAAAHLKEPLNPEPPSFSSLAR